MTWSTNARSPAPSAAATDGSSPRGVTAVAHPVTPGTVRGTVRATRTALCVLLLAAVAVDPAAAQGGGHTVDAVDLVTGAEDAVAVVGLAVEVLQLLAAAVAVLAVRSAVARFRGGVMARGLVLAEGGVGVVLVGQLWHLGSVVAPVEPAPLVAEQAFVLVALLLFAAAAIDLYRSV